MHTKFQFINVSKKDPVSKLHIEGYINLQSTYFILLAPTCNRKNTD